MWAPESVANDAIKHYRFRLREALEKLMETSAELRSRTKSTQSNTLSLDSREDEIYLHATEGYENIPPTSLSHLVP
jgi:hypothetical protein